MFLIGPYIKHEEIQYLKLESHKKSLHIIIKKPYTYRSLKKQLSQMKTEK